MADLQAMARTFTKESTAIANANNAGPQSTPDGGNTTVTSALAGALQAAEFATKQLSEVVASHGTKLNGAYNQYRNAEETSTQLCQQLTNLANGKQ
jgi:hypothetical protein